MSQVRRQKMDHEKPNAKNPSRPDSVRERVRNGLRLLGIGADQAALNRD